MMREPTQAVMPTWTLETARCALRPLSAGDRSGVIELYGDAEVRRYLGGPVSADEAARRFESALASQTPIWAITQKPGGDFIGLVSLDRLHGRQEFEISYQLSPRMWGGGYATEVTKRVLDHALEDLKLPCILAETQAANAASRRVLERAGMQLSAMVERFGVEQAVYSISSKFSS